MSLITGCAGALWRMEDTMLEAPFGFNIVVELTCVGFILTLLHFCSCDDGPGRLKDLFGHQ
jgi:hypothetical protein